MPPRYTAGTLAFSNATGRPRKSKPARALLYGADRDRTGDPLLAKQVLSQLSYRPLLFLPRSPNLPASRTSNVSTPHLRWNGL
jgi:hypothetical protein